MATILVVDDEKPVRNFLRVLLTPPHQVVEEGNVAGAIEAAGRTRPDLVLLDLNVGRRHSGLEVCRALRSDPDPALARVPIVMLTGNSGEADIKAALAAGADGYVRKPYNP